MINKVVLYTRDLCGYCAAAKHLLDSKDISYEEIDATLSPEKRQEMIKRARGQVTFPQIFIGDTHVGGYDDLSILEQTGKLDMLLECA